MQQLLDELKFRTIVNRIIYQHWMDNRPENIIKMVFAGEVKWKLEYGVNIIGPIEVKKKEMKV